MGRCVTIANKDARPDWNAIRAEYIGGHISQRKLAQKYGIADGTLLQRANVEGWKALRDKAAIKSIQKAEQKTADAAASNAAKLERAKGLAIDRLLAILEKYPEDGGDTVRQFEKRRENKYSLLNIVSALEKLDKNSPMEAADDPLMAMLKRWDDASAGK